MGPIMVDLYAAIAGVDSDFFVQLIDKDDRTGAEQFLQYGMLRASYGSGLNPGLSDSANGRMYRPYYAYTNPRLVTPGQVRRYRIEVFPLGWVARPGHTLLLTVSAAPAFYQLYAWGGGYRPPTVNTIYSDRSHPSQLLLPLLPAQDNPAVA